MALRNSSWQAMLAAMFVVILVLAGGVAYEYESSSVTIANQARSLSSMRSEVAALNGEVSNLSAELRSVMPSGVSAPSECSGSTICQSSTYCFVSYSYPIGSCSLPFPQPSVTTALLVVSAYCDSEVVSIKDSLGGVFATDSNLTSPHVGGVHTIVTAHSFIAPGQGIDNITVGCQPSDLMALEVESFQLVTSVVAVYHSSGWCSNTVNRTCGAAIATPSLAFPTLGNRYLAVAAIFAYPACFPGCGTGPGYGFTFNVAHDNRLLAIEYSNTVNSPTTFPAMDGTTPTAWTDAGLVYVLG